MSLMCLTKCNVLGGLYKIPSRTGLYINVNKNTFGFNAKTSLKLYVIELLMKQATPPSLLD